MITVDKFIKGRSKNSAGPISEANEEQLRTGTFTVKKQSYLPWVILLIAGLVGGYLLWKKGKQDNGEVSG
jgi:hypothetical protein